MDCVRCGSGATRRDGHTRLGGQRWRVDETYCRLQGTWAYLYRAIDQEGQVVDVYFSARRNAAAAQAFFERALATSGVRPTRVTTDKAKCYPPALRVTLPDAEHRTSKYLKQRLRPMRGFKQAPSADTVARGHALIRNLQDGRSTLTSATPRPLRLAAAWPLLVAMI